jgi:hypothetical protein
MPFRGDDTDELDRREWPEPDPNDDSEEYADTIPCLFCKKPIYENAEWCPHCHSYLFYDASSVGRKPWWFLGGVAVCLLIVLFWILRA